jgi:hypothetical protein
MGNKDDHECTSSVSELAFICILLSLNVEYHDHHLEENKYYDKVQWIMTCEVKDQLL